MSQYYTIQACEFDHEFDTKYGTMYAYNLTLASGRDGEVQCYINQKDTTPEPMVGTKLYGYISDDKLGNPKFTKEQEPDGAKPSPQAPAKSAKGTQIQAFEDDERQTVIVRQNALTNANSNAAARSQVFIAQQKFDDAERVLKPSSIAFIQHWFYKASMGEWRMDMKVADALNLMGFSQEDIDAFVFERQAELEQSADEEPLPEEPKEADARA